MGDSVRPNDYEFFQVLQKSLKTWESYLGTECERQLLPMEAIHLRSLVSQTPSFLGCDLPAPDEAISFACEEKHSTHGKGSLVINGRSTWRTSKGKCELPPRVLPKQLLLAAGSRLSVKLSEDSPLSEWPGVQGLSGYDKGNYLSVLYFAWAYILSARWVELLSRSADHESHMSYSSQGMESPPRLSEHSTLQIDFGEDACEEELFWWYTILCSDNGWDAATKYNGHVYLSPWSVSAKGARLAFDKKAFVGAKPVPPSSVTALEYLSRFCVNHRLYAQCSVALAGVLYIPFLRREVRLPFPKPVSRLEIKEHVGDSPVSIPGLINDHSELLPRYMTLSSNPWGLRSLLCSTFFNPDIECNLVSAWLNPAFAVLNSISPRGSSVAAFLANRQPQLGILWLGAILTDVANSVLRDIRAGMVALDLPASAWTETTQTFLTSEMGNSQGESMCRDDECRLLLITACEGHDRPPIWPWKPFGFTQLCDTELSAQKHAQCDTHCLEYQSWEWMLTNSGSIQDSGTKSNPSPIKSSNVTVNRKSTRPDDYNYDFYSQTLSEVTTRGIFQWLRSTGYPRNERDIYQHSWLDMEDTDEEDLGDVESDVEIQWSPKKNFVESWLESIE